VQDTTVVLGIEDAALQEEILHFLERVPTVRVVGAAHATPDLRRRVREAHPDAAVVSSTLLGADVDLDGTALLVVDERETTAGLRRAIGAGARGFYLWPEEREVLGRDAGRARRPREQAGSDPGRIVAVYGPRGGAGTTFLATNLAAACARAGSSSLLIDLDLQFADVTAAVGLGAGASDLPSVANLAPVLDELHAEHLERVVQEHDAGFQVLLAPSAAEPQLTVAPSQVTALARVASAGHDAVILHLPRALDAGTVAALEVADVILLVVTLDVLALRDARRALDVLSARGLDRKCRLVVNRASRGELVPTDAEGVLGMPPAAVIRFDRLVPRGQDRGELVVGRSGRAARAVLGLARRLLAEGQRS
jgi:pilus assembly protein CpaE